MIPSPEELAALRRQVNCERFQSNKSVVVPLPMLRYLFGVIDALSTPPMTDEQAKAAYDTAEPVPLPPERIEAIVDHAVNHERRLKEANAQMLAALHAVRNQGLHGELEGGISVSYLVEEAIAKGEQL